MNDSNPQHHDHASHAHHTHHASLDAATSRRKVAAAALLTISFMVVEVIGGLISGSLALLADAAHMLTDSGSLVLAWIGFRLAELPVDDRRSYGWARFKVLAAFVNGLLLCALAGWIVLEAVHRLLDPVEIIGPILLGVAIAGLLVNLLAFWILHRGDQTDLNMRGATWHVLGDLLGSVAAILAAAIIMTTSWTPIDPILSVVVAGIIVFGGVRLIRESSHILIEGVPPGLSVSDIKHDLESHIPSVQSVDHIHAWALTESKPLITLDVEVAEGACAETVRRAVKARLGQRFRIEHATVEVIQPNISA